MIIVMLGGIAVGIIFNGYPDREARRELLHDHARQSRSPSRGIALVITNGSSIGLYQYTKLQNIGNGGIGQFGYLIFISLVSCSWRRS